MKILAALLLFSGEWTVGTDRDSMTDRVLATARLSTAGGELRYQCAAGDRRSLLGIVSETFLGRRIGRFNSGPAMLRFDGQPAQQVDWYYQDDFAHAPLGRETERTLTRIADAERLVVRLFRYDGDPVELSFGLSGARAAINQARSACGEPTI